MNPDPQVPEELLDLMERVTCGDCPTDAPEVRAACAESPEFATWVQGWHETVALLDDAAHMEREVLAGVDDHPHQSFGWGVPLLAAAALALVALTLTLVDWAPESDTPPPAPVFLGGPLPIAMAADGTFEFGIELPQDGWFTIEVAAGTAADPFLTIDKHHEREWRPARDGWPAMAVVHVSAHNSEGDEFATGTLRLP